MPEESATPPAIPAEKLPAPPVCPENRPFLLEPQQPPKGAALLVHGFTASPWEMRPLGEALAEEEKFAGLALLSPFLRLRHRLAPLVGLLRHVKRHQRRRLPEHLAPYYYDQRPLNGIHQIRRLIRRIEPTLESIHTPVLVLTALGDRTVDAASAHRLYERLGSPRKELHQFDAEIGHDLATRGNPRWEETRKRILDFFSGLPAGA